MEAIEVQVEGRHNKGSSSVQRDRRAGKIPAVMYSRGLEARLLTLNEQEYVRRVQGAGPTQLFKLRSELKDFDGQLVLIKDLQMEPIKGKVLHLDFLALSVDQRIIVEVPIELTGESPAVKSGEYILNVSSHKVSVECLPNEIPRVVLVDISTLTGAESIHASDLVLPANVKLKTDPSKSIVSVVHKKEEVEAAPTAVATDATAAAGTEGAAAAGAAAGAEKGDKAEKK